MKYSLMIVIVTLSIAAKTSAMEEKNLTAEEKNLIAIDEKNIIKISPRKSSNSPETRRKIKDSVPDVINAIPETFRKSAKVIASSKITEQTLPSQEENK